MHLSKKYCALLAVFTAFSYTAQAAYYSAEAIYDMARNRQNTELSKLGTQIDAKNADDNTALCLALAHKDTQSYNTLLHYGADTSIKCPQLSGLSSGDNPYYGQYQNGGYYPNGGYEPQTKSSGTFLGMGPVGWGVVGVLAVGGGIAIAASSGGGGHGGSSSSSKPADKCGADYVTEPCADTEYMTKCEADATRHKCQTRTNTQHCTAYTTEADTCTACDNGYLLNDGRCNTCDTENDYVDDGNGNCVPRYKKRTINTDTIIIRDKTAASSDEESTGMIAGKEEKAINRGTIKLLDNQRNVIGMAADGGVIRNEGEISSSGNSGDETVAMSATNKGKAENLGTISLSDNTGNTYGISGSENSTIYNNYAITITGNKNGDNESSSSVAGIYTKESAAYSTAGGRILLKQNFVGEALGNVYGMKAIQGTSVHLGGGDITISENGGNSIYGMYGDSKIEEDAETAISTVISGSPSNSGGIYLIQNSSRNIYGMYTGLEGENPEFELNTKADCDVGLGSCNSGTIAIGENTYDDTDDDTKGEAYGMYSRFDNAENEGRIDLSKNQHSVAGINVGDGASATNKMFISINENSGEYAYGMDGTAVTTNWEKGAYKVHGGTITNSGTISMDKNTSDAAIGMRSRMVYKPLDQYPKLVGSTPPGGTAVNAGIINITENESFVSGMFTQVGTLINEKDASINLSKNKKSSASTYGIVASHLSFDDVQDSENISGMSTINNAGAIDLSENETESTYGILAQVATIPFMGGIEINNSGTVTLNKNTNHTRGIYGVLYEGSLLNINNTGTVTLNENSGDTDIDGIYIAVSTDDYQDFMRATATNSGDIIMDSNEGNVTGITVTDNASAENSGNITLSNNDSAYSYGIYTDGKAIVANDGDITLSNNHGLGMGMSALNSSTIINSGDILINENEWSIGMGSGEGSTATNSGNITVTKNTNQENNYGMLASGNSSTATNSGNITLSENTGRSYGLFASQEASVTNAAGGTVNIDKVKYAYGVYAYSNSTALNAAEGIVNINETENAFGMYASGGSTITNAADGVINIDGAEIAIGMYAEDGSAENKTKVINAGQINITNSTHAYGIWAEGENVEVTNSGTITIDGSVVTDTCTGSECGNANHAIVLNGGTLQQSGLIQATSINLDSFGGEVIAANTARFEVEEDISGDLTMSSSIVENGFATTYSVKDMIQADDTSGLNLQSQSALFEATLENDSDAVMTMKAFGDVVENSSIADFLQNNYAEGNNEQLFAGLKSAKTAAQLNSNIDDLFGKDMLSRMAFEDLSMLREVSFDMNNNLFKQEGAFSFGNNISPSSYDNNLGSVGRYALSGYNSGKTSFGVGVSITDVRTADKHNDNSRFDRNFMLSAPIGYKTHGFELITAPKMGYADGSYDRDGLNNMAYDGKIQKRMLALMNEARYPIKFGGMKLIPTAEFNMIGYNIKGHEDEQPYALRINSQNHYSVEAGLGLMAQKEFKPYKNHKFNLNGGVTVYHEFANPYELDVAMNGMSGTYRLQDEKRGDNRAAVRFGFGYALQDYLDVTANLLTNIDREYRTDASVNLKYSF